MGIEWEVIVIGNGALVRSHTGFAPAEKVFEDVEKVGPWIKEMSNKLREKIIETEEMEVEK